eukprot:TRINITY_DN3167_c0_g1_i2.p2 TRINITY_DN3167_c0_g1~~TRINITY_DN3167_c0_g1_i2.p2  ORF type:complete len:227 (-),score=49.89 TRINITY_DN3167_c0_g1_i2:220-873(-)
MARKKTASFQKLPKSTVIDGNDHILGRLAATVAKHLLRGERVTVVRCEGLIMSGPFRRNKLKFIRWFNKRHVTNPKRGPFHFRGPSHIFTRVVRGMIPYCTKRGSAAMRRLVATDGCPPPYDTVKHQVCPRASRKLRLDPVRKWCTLGRISSEIGWQHRDTVARLEAKRKVRSTLYFESKKKALVAREEAAKKVDATLAKHIGQEKVALLRKVGVVA